MSLRDFYLACCVGDVDAVQYLLDTLSLDALNHIESNGSTALHAASYYGHIDIVRLLLEKGAQRHLLNMFDLTAADEAQTDEMKELFNRDATTAAERFVGESPRIEWSKAGLHSAYTSFRSWDKPVEFESIEATSEEISAAHELRDAAGMDQIRHFLNMAVEAYDCTYFIRAYTAETDFYKRLNRLYAQTNLDYTEAGRNKWFIKFSTVLKNNWEMRKYWWTGMCFRGLNMTEDDLDEYKVDEMITNKAFMSTSKNSDLAVQFLSKVVPGTRPVLCVYCIQHHEIAMDISSLSEYPNEEEVLIFPNIQFKLVDITHGDLIMMALIA
jgi:hypothetical protein